jgi:hypothetical protein
VFSPGPIGLVSRSGTLTYQIGGELAAAGLGNSTIIGIGGDPVIGTSFIDALDLFEGDPQTEMIVMVGEIGGDAEEQAAEVIAERITKPVVAYIAGFEAPPGKTMGHAGAIISGSAGTAAAKKAALEAKGVPVGTNPTEAARIVAERYGSSYGGPVRRAVTARRVDGSSSVGGWADIPTARQKMSAVVGWAYMGNAAGGGHFCRAVGMSTPMLPPWPSSPSRAESPPRISCPSTNSPPPSSARSRRTRPGCCSTATRWGIRRSATGSARATATTRQGCSSRTARSRPSRCSPSICSRDRGDVRPSRHRRTTGRS